MARGSQPMVFLSGRVAVETDGVVVDDARFPGRQGRVLFAYLVAEQGRPVPRDELAEALWGETPPASWDKALTGIVSKLRSLLADQGIDGATALTGAFGCYRLELPEGTWVDVVAAADAAAEAEAALAVDNFAVAREAAARAESLLRRSFLPGEEGTWVEEKRRELANVRERALDVLAEAALRSGDALEAVRWAEQATVLAPFRESGYRRLMEAHVAAGNRAEALRVYERCRRLLAEELGAYPSPETDSIYRSLLEAPSRRAAAELPATLAPGPAPPPASRRRHSVLAAATLVVLVVLVAAATAIAVLATRADKPRAASVTRLARVALVVSRLAPGSDDPSYAQYVDALESAPTEFPIRTRTVQIDPSKPLSGRVRKSIGNFDLVLLAGQFVASRFAREFGRHRQTRFVVLDPDPVNGSLYRAVSMNPNASDVFFIEGPGAYLAGFVSALVAERTPGKRAPAVSMIGSYPAVNENVTSTFRDGARAAVGGIRVFEQESHDVRHPAVCEAIANEQIDRGSSVVYADAGACSAGALSAAEARGVWGVAGDRDPRNPPVGSRILGYTVKNFRQEVGYAIRSYVDHTLPHRRHLDIGIERGAVDFVPTRVPKGIRARFERVKQQHMKRWENLAMLK